MRCWPQFLPSPHLNSFLLTEPRSVNKSPRVTDILLAFWIKSFLGIFFTNPKSLGACAYANFPWVLHALGGMLTRATWSPGQPSVPGLFPKPIPSWRSMSPHFWLAERYSGSSISDTLVCWYPGIDAQESGGLCSQLHWTDRMYICNSVHETLSGAFEVADTGICLIKWMDW